MEIGTALASLAAIIVAVTVLGVYLRSRDGRITVTTPTGTVVDPAEIGLARFADGATLVQFSTATCARCPGVRRLLSALAADEAGVEHVDVDLTHRVDLASRFGIMQTPTTLVIASDGSIRARIAGTPTLGAVREHLAALRTEQHVSSSRY